MAWLLAADSPGPVSTLAEEAGPWTPQLNDTLVLLVLRSGAASLLRRVAPAADAVCRGHRIRYECGQGLDNIGFWWDPGDWVQWKFVVRRAGTFNVSADIAAEGSGGFELIAGGRKLPAQAPATGSYAKFTTARLGRIDIPSPGIVWLEVRAIRDGWKPFNLKSISLQRDPAGQAGTQAASQPAAAVASAPAAANPAKADAATSAPSARVTHYAVMMTGPSVKRLLGPIYWAANQQIQEMLSGYGYPDEAIYRLHEQGKSKAPQVDGKSSLANLREVMAHLARILKKDDHLVVFLVGHGTPVSGEIVYLLTDGNALCPLSPTELRALLHVLPTPHVTVVMNFCHSGAFVPKLSRPGRVVCSCNRADETNAKPWIQAFTKAIDPKDAAAPVSVKQAYNAALDAVVKMYHGDTREHPLLDDNGDGDGHFGTEPVVEGDGELAAKRFLGDDGRKLNLPPAAIEELKRLNAKLVLE